MMNKRANISLLLLAILLVLLTGACDDGASPAAVETTTIPPTDAVLPTDTPTNLPPTSTDTPEPTTTPTEVPTDTPEPTATPDLLATAAVEETQVAEESLGFVLEELAHYGVPADSGRLAWTASEPVILESDPGWGVYYHALDEGTEYSSYVLHMDVTWESDTGLAGCGVIFHSTRNLELGKQYQFWAARLSGLPVWSVELYEYGYFVSSAMGESKVNSAIRQENGSVNKYVLVIKKGIMTAFANGERLSNVMINSIDHGRIAYMLWQESGVSTCAFENVWIWEFTDD